MWLWFAGSLLVACAHFGAYVVGADIDHKLLHGRGLYTDTTVQWIASTTYLLCIVSTALGLGSESLDNFVLTVLIWQQCLGD